MHAVFVKAKLDFSVFGLGVTVENAVPVTDIENVIEIMLSHIKRLGKRLLITIDEVINSENIKIFASSFQIFLREEYPIYLLMTGLYENIYDLQNEKSLTFLYRAPKIILEPLNYTAIKSHYMRIFDINDEMADKMTLLTRGYPFAFQVLGYLNWDNRKDHTLEDIMPEYDQYLDEYVYSKIWAELSPKDKEILSVISESGYQSVRLMLLSDNIPEVLVCANDNMAIGAMKALRQEGLKIPDDIAVTGFDGTEMSELMGLTTVDIPDYERGYLAAQFLLQNNAGSCSFDTYKIAAKVHWRKNTR